MNSSFQLEKSLQREVVWWRGQDVLGGRTAATSRKDQDMTENLCVGGSPGCEGGSFVYGGMCFLQQDRLEGTSRFHNQKAVKRRKGVKVRYIEAAITSHTLSLLVLDTSSRWFGGTSISRQGCGTHFKTRT